MLSEYMEAILDVKNIQAKKLRMFVLFTFSISLFLTLTIPAKGETGCFVEHKENNLILGSEHFVLKLDLSDGVCSEVLENRHTGKKIDLGKGQECSLRFSATLDRIELVGWKQKTGGSADQTPDKETGLTQGYHQVDYEDNQWESTFSPWSLGLGWACGNKRSPNPEGYNWYRVKFDLPDVKGQPVTFGVGGGGLEDFGHHRFFVNGVLIGERTLEEQDWAEPTLITLTSEDSGYAALNFGKNNTLAIQAWEQFDPRPARLKELDPNHQYETARLLLLMDQFITIGLPYEDVFVTKVKNVEVVSEGEQEGHVKLILSTNISSSIELVLHYEWTATEPVLRKWLEFTNTTGKEKLLLDVEMGNYTINVPCSEGFRGYPVYLDEDIFASISHPAGVAQGSKGRLRLRHFPGKYIGQGEKFISKEAVFGMAMAGNHARQTYWDYLLNRSMRRQIEGVKSAVHVDGLAAAWCRSTPWGETDPPSEKVCIEILDRMAAIDRQWGIDFDYLWIDAGWWTHSGGDTLRVFNEIGFPEGIKKTIQHAKDKGIAMGLWYGHGPRCAVPEETLGMWKDVLHLQLVENGFKGLKFDGRFGFCFDEGHSFNKQHLPGKYSVEPIMDRNIELYKYARQLCPEIWIYGYWGHDSPWWLEYVDVTFDHGLDMEMQNLSAYPTIWERDSIIINMDQAQQYRHDMPSRGRYTLGVWTGTGWAGFGFERLFENISIDICRGPGILHLWTDIRQYSNEELETLSRLVKILKSYPVCFNHSKPIIGDPWKGEPYGYSCSDGERTFIAINNPTWLDQRIKLHLAEKDVGLKNNGKLELYRHVPRPAHLLNRGSSTLNYEDELEFYLRPFEIVLWEITPTSKGPAIAENWNDESLTTDPLEPAAIQLPLGFDIRKNTSVVRAYGDVPPYPVKSTLTLVLKMSKDGKDWKEQIPPVAFCHGGRVGDVNLGSTGFTRNHCGTRFGSWIVYRIPLEASDKSRQVDICLMELQPKDVQIDHTAYLIPKY